MEIVKSFYKSFYLSSDAPFILVVAKKEAPVYVLSCGEKQQCLYMRQV